MRKGENKQGAYKRSFRTKVGGEGTMSPKLVRMGKRIAANVAFNAINTRSATMDIKDARIVRSFVMGAT